jgi:hypothetical protein
LFYSTTSGAPIWKLLFYFRTTPEQKKRRAEARGKGLLPEWRGAIRAPLHKNTREGKREAFLRRPIVEPAQPEQVPCVYECSAAAFQERHKILAEEWKPINPVLKFLPIARKLMSQAELEEAISKRPDSDYRINLSKRGRYSTRPEQQQQQEQKEEEEGENEFDGIQLLWVEPESSEQLKI